jgi:hypothetical protein
MTSTTSRRTLLTTAAALPALAVPALASAAPDPIFAAIEVHRQAYAEFEARVRCEFALEDELPMNNRESRIDAYHEKIVETDDPRWVPALRATEEGSDLAELAAIKLLNVDPTTIAGVAALLEYFAEVEVVDDGGFWPESVADGDDPAVKKRSASFGYFVARDAARALRRVIAAQA